MPRTEEEKSCINLPANVNSFGVWESLSKSENALHIWDYALPLFETLFCILFCLWQFFHLILKRLGFIMFTSQMLAGLMLSQLFLRKKSWLVDDIIRPDSYDMHNVFGTFGYIGYSFFYFLMGVKMDVGLVFNTGKKAIVIGILSVLIPLVFCGMLYKEKLSRDIGKNTTGNPIAEVATILVIQSLTTFPVVVNLLTELKVQNSELGRLAMSSSVISDITSFIFSLFFLTHSNWTHGNEGKAIMGAGTFILISFLAFFIFRPKIHLLIERTPEGKPVKDVYIYAIVLIVLANTLISLKNGVFSVFTSFILGLTVPSGPPLGTALVGKLDCLTSGFFMPFLVAMCTMKSDFSLFMQEKTERADASSASEIMALILVSLVVKFVASAATALFAKMPVIDSLVLALIMCQKGVVELVSYGLSYENEAFRQSTFSITVCYILANSAIIPLLVRNLYKPSRKYAGYMKRNMLHLKPNSELRILACIHRPDDIKPMINILEVSCPMEESPISAFALHLIELTGRAQPLFLSHKLQMRRITNHQYSDNVIISFTQFQRQCRGPITVDVFTSVSEPILMHDDVGTLALDKATSLIILPFHRRWSIDGSTLVSDKKAIQNLNMRVLEKAPCSVAILVDRSRIGRRTVREAELSGSLYNVCMVFLGGKDDFEALTLTKRMTEDPRVSITLVHLVGKEQNGGSTWDRRAAHRGIAGLIQAGGNVRFVEQAVKDGIETALILRSMAAEYDLFMVGRGSGRESDQLTQGLEQWTEFPELGVLGDLLASSDLDSRASVLVVQQQQQMT